MSEKPIAPVSPELGYDRHEPSTRILTLIAVVMTVVLVVLVVGVYVFYVFSLEKVEEDQVLKVYSEELRAIHAREEEQLNHYGFIDKEKGVVRIPIDRSMELLVQDIRAGKVPYNIKTYPLRPEQPEGAAAGTPAAPGAPPAGGAPANAPPH